MISNAKQSFDLELLCSSKKDRTLQLSALNALESQRFQQAYYRLCIIDNLFNARISSAQAIFYEEDHEQDGNQEEDTLDDHMRHEQVPLKTKQEAYLSSLSVSELKAALEVNDFFYELMSWATHEYRNTNANPHALGGLCSLNRPCKFRSLIETRDDLPDGINIGVVAEIFNAFWPSRPSFPVNISFVYGDRLSRLRTCLTAALQNKQLVDAEETLSSPETSSLTILDQIPQEAMDKCELCSASKGADLYNSKSLRQFCLITQSLTEI